LTVWQSPTTCYLPTITSGSFLWLPFHSKTNTSTRKQKEESNKQKKNHQLLFYQLSKVVVVFIMPTQTKLAGFMK
jgi:spermidine synthase